MVLAAGWEGMPQAEDSAGSQLRVLMCKAPKIVAYDDQMQHLLMRHVELRNGLFRIAAVVHHQLDFRRLFSLGSPGAGEKLDAVCRRFFLVALVGILVCNRERNIHLE